MHLAASAPCLREPVNSALGNRGARVTVLGDSRSTSTIARFHSGKRKMSLNTALQLPGAAQLRAALLPRLWSRLGSSARSPSQSVCGAPPSAVNKGPGPTTACALGAKARAALVQLVGAVPGARVAHQFIHQRRLRRQTGPATTPVLGKSWCPPNRRLPNMSLKLTRYGKAARPRSAPRSSCAARPGCLASTRSLALR